LRCWNLLYSFLAKDVGELGVAEDLSVCVCDREQEMCKDARQSTGGQEREGKGALT
jgi:hypothetical protein